MKINEEFKIVSLSMVEKFEGLGWIKSRIEVGESENLLGGDARIATIPQYICHLTTLGQQRIAEIKPFIVSA